jgi:3-oxoacyl-(acyl-carrier-protein) synthase
MRRVIVITGIGMVTPLGHDPPTLWQRMKAGNSAAAPPAHFDATPFACPVCAEVRDFQPQRYGPKASWCG